MRTVKWNSFLSGVCGGLGGILVWAGAAWGVTTNSAAIVIFPKIVVDQGEAARTDTIIQLTNTAPAPINVRCFYVNANGHCASDGTTICDPEAPLEENLSLCGSLGCTAGWTETDFAFRLTANQPISWNAGDGLAELPLSSSFGPGAQSNVGSIPAVPENPFRGELKCVEVGPDELPVGPACDLSGDACTTNADCPEGESCIGNDLQGLATLQYVDSDGPFVDSWGYNATGLPAIAGANDGDNTLVLGQEYEGCPSYLVLDHFFDNATEPAAGDTVTTYLTLVPCSEDFNLQAPNTTVVQFRVFNEFEQRFSTSTSVKCFSERQLSRIHSQIFNVGVEGTLTGQTFIRGVQDSSETSGHGLLGIAEEVQGDFTAAFNLHKTGVRTQNDVIVLPSAGAPSTP
jgi:hypothetical protein